MLRQVLYRLILPRLVKRACESTIPRSGKKGEAVNCFVVALDRNDTPFFVATGMSGRILSGLQYDGNSYSQEATLDIAELDNGRLNVTHYIGLSSVSYDNIYEVAWHLLTRLIYLRIFIFRKIDSTYQYLYNKRDLVTKKRMELLRFMMDDQLDRSHNGIRILDLMEKLYSMRLFLHPSWETQEQRIKLYLDSLVLSGDLDEMNQVEYVVTGQAITTLEKYEEEDARHKDSLRLQKVILALTVVALFFTIVQSGVIKLPTLFDLS